MDRSATPKAGTVGPCHVTINPQLKSIPADATDAKFSVWAWAPAQGGSRRGVDETRILVDNAHRTR